MLEGDAIKEKHVKDTLYDALNPYVLLVTGVSKNKRQTGLELTKNNKVFQVLHNELF